VVGHDRVLFLIFGERGTSEQQSKAKYSHLCSAERKRSQAQNGINGEVRRGAVYAGFELELAGARALLARGLWHGLVRGVVKYLSAGAWSSSA
jgi:hypothetical protein